MQFVLTTAGQAAIAGSPGVPPVLSLYKLGNMYGYVPAPTDLDIHGAQVWSGVPSDPVVQINNVIKYTVSLDATLGDFQFGEVGLYLPGNVLFALGSASYYIEKLQNAGVQIGNNLVIDAYITTSGTDYAIYAELGNSKSTLNVQAIPGVDTLPSSFQAYPNIYMIGAPDQSGTILAFSNNSYWSFTGYEEVADVQVVISATSNTITVGAPSIAPAYPGELIIQVMDGPAIGVSRIVTGYTSVGYTFSVATPYNQTPQTNNNVRILKKTQLRPNVAALLAGLELGLTAGHLNDLLDYPLDQMVKKDGTVAMLAPFNAGTHRIIDVGTPVLNTDAATKGYVDDQTTASAATIAALSAAVTDMQNKYFRKDGALPMTGNLNFGGFRGLNLAAPVNASDAATKAYVDNTVAAGIASISLQHNNLLGLQGGGIGEFYHLTAAERAWVTNYYTNGLPVSSYSTIGIVQLSDANVTGQSLSSTTAITPESLYLAISNAGINSLQTAILNLINSKSSVIQTGAGAPTGFTATDPEIYLDTSVNPPIPWVYYSGVWREITAKIAQFGPGAPTGATPITPILYFDTSAGLGKWVLYVYSGGLWHKIYTEYMQHGLGAPTGATPTSPTSYIDVTTVPYTQYTYYGAAWHKVGTYEVTEVDLYYFGQL
jgi:hypothetical protein